MGEKKKQEDAFFVVANRVSFVTILGNVLMSVFKLTAGIVAHSNAMISDAMHSASDVFSTIVVIIGIKLSSKESDKEHPYGHGRIEYFASIIIAVIVLVAGLTALKESVQKITKPEQANYSIVSLIIIIVAILVKFFFGK